MSRPLYIATSESGASNWLVQRVDSDGTSDDFQVGHGGSQCSCEGFKQSKKTRELCKHVAMVRSHAELPLSAIKKTKAIKLATKLMQALAPHVRRIFIQDVEMRRDQTVKKVVIGAEPNKDAAFTRLARIVYSGLPCELVIY